MDTPEVFFRETIDLNRYSNSVAKKYAVTYNEIIVNAAKQLKQINLTTASDCREQQEVFSNCTSDKKKT